jgi:hypothetical protein
MARCQEAPACDNDARETASTQRGRTDDGRGIPQEAPQTLDDRSSRVDRQIARVGEVAFPTALAQTVWEVLAGLINPLADQRKITLALMLGERHDDDDRDCVQYRAGAVAGLLH